MTARATVRGRLARVRARLGWLVDTAILGTIAVAVVAAALSGRSR